MPDPVVTWYDEQEKYLASWRIEFPHHADKAAAVGATAEGNKGDESAGVAPPVAQRHPS